MLTALDLAGIPLEARDRTVDHPIVLAGGHAAFNPEPIADFIDGAVIGDGEQAVLDDHRRSSAAWKAEGRPGGREELLLRLAKTGGVYVPRLLRRRVPARTAASPASYRTGRGVPWRVSKHTVMDLDEWPYPKQPLVPLAETVHERMSVEIFRGCTRGCRFCQAGMITRPVRERSITGIGEMVEKGLKATGFEEVGLLSLSSADHTEIGDIAKGLADRYEEDKIGLSLPSTRVDAFNVDLANELTRNGRRSGLTFAPEGGSERMRKVINKMVSEEDLIRTVATAYGNGWRQVKLYFMCGLPTETDEDVLQIGDMAVNVIAKGREVSGQNDIRCTVSIGGFVPKPHTPFQWAPQLSAEDDRRPAGEAARQDPRRQEVRPLHRLPLPRRQARHRRGPALPRRPPRRRGDPRGLRGRRPLRRLARALLATTAGWPAPRRRCPSSASTSPGTRRASAPTRRSCPGTTWTPASTRTGSGRTGRTRSTRPRSRTAAGRRASTAASARSSTPTSRSARRGRSCCR